MVLDQRAESISPDGGLRAGAAIDHASTCRDAGISGGHHSTFCSGRQTGQRGSGETDPSTSPRIRGLTIDPGVSYVSLGAQAAFAPRCRPTAVQSQKALAVYLWSKQLLPFGFARQS